jgi:hypothetical protein
MASPKLQPGDPTETIAAYIDALIQRSGSVPTIDLVSFSGKEEDVLFDADAVYLRVHSHRARDQQGRPYELWGRLTSPGGLWSIPDEPTEMLLFAAPHTSEVAGTAWLMHTAQLPAGIQLGNITNGRAVLASPKGGSAVLFGDDDSISLKVTDSVSGQDILLMLTTTGDGVRIQTPWGKVSLGPRGFHVFLPGGARLDLGSYSLGPGPFSLFTSYASIKASSVTVAGSSATKLGRGPYFTAALSPAPGPFGLAGFGSSQVCIGV